MSGDPTRARRRPTHATVGEEFHETVFVILSRRPGRGEVLVGQGEIGVDEADKSVPLPKPIEPRLGVEFLSLELGPKP